MANLTLAVHVSRAYLGLADLNINDHDSYVVSDTFLSGAVAWQRNQVTSQWMDGEVTVSQRKPNIVETVEVLVYGTNQSTLRSRTITLVDAFEQFMFNLKVEFNGVARQYNCLSADYTIEYDKSKIRAPLSVVRFQVPREPYAVAGI